MAKLLQYQQERDGKFTPGQVQRAEEKARKLAPMKVKDKTTNAKRNEASSALD
jgi:curli production assembly/transport component CsgG